MFFNFERQQRPWSCGKMFVVLFTFLLDTGFTIMGSIIFTLVWSWSTEWFVLKFLWILIVFYEFFQEVRGHHKANWVTEMSLKNKGETNFLDSFRIFISTCQWLNFCIWADVSILQHIKKLFIYEQCCCKWGSSRTVLDLLFLLHKQLSAFRCSWPRKLPTFYGTQLKATWITYTTQERYVGVEL